MHNTIPNFDVLRSANFDVLSKIVFITKLIFIDI